MTATAEELSNEILGIVQDYSFVFANVLTLMNEALDEISGRVVLPDCLTDDTLDTDTSESFKALPTDYQRNLYRCYSTTNNRRIKIWPSLTELLRQYSQPDLGGSVTGVAVRSVNLHYQRIPATAETLKLYYLKNPTVLSGLSDTPDEIPDQYVRPLMVNYCCARMFLRKITGDANERVWAEQKAKEHFALYEQALRELELFLGPYAHEPEEEVDEYYWEECFE